MGSPSREGTSQGPNPLQWDTNSTAALLQEPSYLIVVAITADPAEAQRPLAAGTGRALPPPPCFAQLPAGFSPSLPRFWQAPSSVRGLSPTALGWPSPATASASCSWGGEGERGRERLPSRGCSYCREVWGDFSLSPGHRYKRGGTGMGAEAGVSCLSSPWRWLWQRRYRGSLCHPCPPALSPAPGREVMPTQGKPIS